MNILELEITICNELIKHNKLMIKHWKIFRWFSFSMLCSLLIIAYYFDGANWSNGIGIGSQFIFILMSFKEVYHCEMDNKLQDARMELFEVYNNIKNESIIS